MSCDKTARIIIKLGQGLPTIPVSTDHRNGDWIATDIYEGEQYMDTNTGLVYTRNGLTIVPSSTANFANTNLTFTGNRSHDTDGNFFELTTDNGAYGEGYLYVDTTEMYAGVGSAYVYSDGSDVSMYVATGQAVKVDSDGTLTSNFGRVKSYSGVNATLTLNETYHVVNCTNTITVNLPSSVTLGPGREYIIKNSGAGTITIDPDGAETIDGAATVALAQWEAVTIVSTGTNWIITSRG